MRKFYYRCIQIISDYVHPLQEKGINGFRPEYLELDTMKISKRNVKTKTKQPVYDPLKLSYLKKMLKEADDTKIVFAVSPYWDGADTIPFQSVKEICKERNIPFIDFSNNPKYVHHNEYFYDGGHLNARGADEFTRDFVHELKKRGIVQ